MKSKNLFLILVVFSCSNILNTNKLKAESYQKSYRERGNESLLKKNLSNAINYFTKALHNYPNDFFIYFQRGLARYENGDINGSIEDYTKSINLNPFNREAYNNRGVSYSILGEYKKAISDFNNALHETKSYENKNDILENLAFAKFSFGDYSEAKEDYFKIINNNPSNSNAYTGLGKIFYYKNDLDSALINLSKATKLNSKDQYAYFYKGKTFYKLNRLSESENNFSKSIKIDPFNEEFFTKRALARKKMNNKFSACKDLEQAIYLGKKEIDKKLFDYCKAF
ncbi:tetratricopeptide repeat protein [Prochlorococcus sp. AH-736-A13]|nr:tetratricopeptide repeat protein [Prochlorococcus sp. AH-736-A13]